MSAIGALSAGNVTTGSVPRAMTVVGMKSSTCWNPMRIRRRQPVVQCETGRDAAAHARATSRETIGAAGVSGVEANCALRPSIQRRPRSVSW
ncbi:Uncharacterised protein [Mycobacterium tuberculosis]|uniref:Uncharacterized protein n=1 Tax=Mycobacterium tuberculosis TaxID=1773 RepID=A0A916LA50_MYCTX|nr:Uncharacterised protein [Mycobacterium tuberculosis]